MSAWWRLRWFPNTPRPRRSPSALRCGTWRIADDPHQPDSRQAEEAQGAEPQFPLPPFPRAGPGGDRPVSPDDQEPDRDPPVEYPEGDRGNRAAQKRDRGGREVQGAESGAPAEGGHHLESADRQDAPRESVRGPYG